MARGVDRAPLSDALSGRDGAPGGGRLAPAPETPFGSSFSRAIMVPRQRLIEQHAAMAPPMPQATSAGHRRTDICTRPEPTAFSSAKGISDTCATACHASCRPFRPHRTRPPAAPTCCQQFARHCPELPAVLQLQPTQLPLTSSMNTAGLSRLEPAASCAPGTPTGGEADGGEELLLACLAGRTCEVAMTQA